MASTTQFLVIDDHPLYLEALEAAIRQGFEDVDIELTETIVDAQHFLEKGTGTDVVLLDLRMPGESGFEALTRIKGLWPRLPVIIISSLKDPDVIEHARSLGASGAQSSGSLSRRNKTRGRASEKLVKDIRRATRKQY